MDYAIDSSFYTKAKELLDKLEQNQQLQQLATKNGLDVKNSVQLNEATKNNIATSVIALMLAKQSNDPRYADLVKYGMDHRRTKMDIINDYKDQANQIITRARNNDFIDTSDTFADFTESFIQYDTYDDIFMEAAEEAEKKGEISAGRKILNVLKAILMVIVLIPIAIIGSIIGLLFGGVSALVRLFRKHDLTKLKQRLMKLSDEEKRNFVIDTRLISTAMNSNTALGGFTEIIDNSLGDAVDDVTDAFSKDSVLGAAWSIAKGGVKGYAGVTGLKAELTKYDNEFKSDFAERKAEELRAREPDLSDEKIAKKTKNAKPKPTDYLSDLDSKKLKLSTLKKLYESVSCLGVLFNVDISTFHDAIKTLKSPVLNSINRKKRVDDNGYGVVDDGVDSFGKSVMDGAIENILKTKNVSCVSVISSLPGAAIPLINELKSQDKKDLEELAEMIRDTGKDEDSIKSKIKSMIRSNEEDKQNFMSFAAGAIGLKAILGIQSAWCSSKMNKVTSNKNSGTNKIEIVFGYQETLNAVNGMINLKNNIPRLKSQIDAAKKEIKNLKKIEKELIAKVKEAAQNRGLSKETMKLINKLRSSYTKRNNWLSFSLSAVKHAIPSIVRSCSIMLTALVSGGIYNAHQAIAGNTEVQRLAKKGVRNATLIGLFKAAGKITSRVTKVLHVLNIEEDDTVDDVLDKIEGIIKAVENVGEDALKYKLLKDRLKKLEQALRDLDVLSPDRDDIYNNIDELVRCMDEIGNESLGTLKEVLNKNLSNSNPISGIARSLGGKASDVFNGIKNEDLGEYTQGDQDEYFGNEDENYDW